ncbi:MAG TPA: DUF3179 domain-containing (seleno)protein [Euzebya sp.]|nr:DUF3179 domain-containing (seleno)protein [Euzebya sp.]
MSSWMWVILIAVVALMLAVLAGADRPDGTTSQDEAADGTATDDDDTDGSDTTDTSAVATTPDPTEGPGDPAQARPSFAPAPAVPSGPISAPITAMLDQLVANPAVPDLDAVTALGGSEDPRVLWVLSDVLRLASDQATYDSTTDAASALAGVDLRTLGDFSWGPLTDHLIAWDLPAFDGYTAYKQALFTALEPGWQPFFADADSTIDWRLVSWGGVRIDDRPLGDASPCPGGCIPSLDDPVRVPAADGDYYPDDAIVFGVRIGEEAVALPRNMMEVHEMVNATIGGRRVAIPYCTLCGAAQVFFTDIEGGGTGEIVMRTSGLLRRSNKVMYDLTTLSVFDTFTGEALSGPLQDAGTQLQQSTVVTTAWAAWRAANPDTTIIAEDGGIGRSYPLDPLRGRDDDGPIFPIGERDDRLAVQEPVLGVVLGDGTTIAFPVAAVLEALAAGEEVTLAGVQVREEAGGVVAEVQGRSHPSHQAFWFAWSQFHPDTLLWDGS